MPSLKLVAKLVVILCLAGGSFVAGRLSMSTPPPELKGESPAPAILVGAADFERNEVTEYRFISPLLECENSTPRGLRETHQIETAVDAEIADAKQRGDITMAAVYFRDLNNGPWFGKNEKEPFFPASLLKVPLMMTYLRAAESDPSIFRKKIVYDGAEFPITQNYVYGEPLKRGRSYSVKELLEKMIQTSDNTSMGLLTDDRLMQLDQMERVYKELGIESPDKIGYQTDPVTYASFFRILYNATYVSRDLSEYALELMSHSDFDDGLRAGIPDNVVVSHKFGERFNEQTGERQLHDCGIVYKPGKPYLVCIMTRGRDFKRLSSVIQSISRRVWAATE